MKIISLKLICIFIFILVGKNCALNPLSNNETCQNPVHQTISIAYSTTKEKIDVPSYAQNLIKCQFSTNKTTFYFDSKSIIDLSGEWIIFGGVPTNTKISINNILQNSFQHESNSELNVFFFHLPFFPQNITFEKDNENINSVHILSPVLFKFYPGMKNAISKTPMLVSVTFTSILFFLVVIGCYIFSNH